jgi:hypothetical protein
MSTQAIDSLKQLQESFFGHLVGQQTDAVNHIISTPDRTSEQRLHIYASGYRLRLKEAITTDFDRLFSYLGDELFEQLMDAYIDRYQSQHTSLRFYSQHMIEMLQSTEPFCLYPEILELAQIEQSFNDSFDAADSNTIGIQELALIEAEAWEHLRIQFHASVQLLDLQTNSFLIWKSLADEQTPPAAIKETSSWLVWRKELVSRFMPLSEAEACIFRLALQGKNFVQLCEALNDFVDEQQTAMQMMSFLQGWIDEKMVCRLS